MKRCAGKLWFICFFSFLCAVSAQDQCKPVGWVTQNGGVSGGGSGTPVTVSNYNDLKGAVTGSAKVVHVSGRINIPGGGRISIQDLNGKSIIGLPGSKLVSTDMSSGGSGIFYIKRCNNLILRNLVFEGPGAYDVDGSDNLCIDDSRNVWVDHCEFHDGVDGNFDIKNKADFISVTWCTFSYEKPPRAGGSGGSNDHRYSNLIGSSDNATGDAGHLNVTFYYCWWGEGCRERMPRMRFGKLHMVNNLFSSRVSNHCIRAGYKADILAVGNYFDNQKKPFDEFKGNYTAIKAYDNHGAGNISKNNAFTPPYSIDIANAQSIVTPIKKCAGATLDSPEGCSECGDKVNKKPLVSITEPDDNAHYDAPATITITATASDEDGTVANVEFFNGATLLGTDNSSPYSYSWTGVTTGTYTISAKATDNQGETATSSEITIIVDEPTTPSLSATDNTIQTVDSGTVIDPIVFTWGGAATDVNYSTLPEGLTASRDAQAKTLTISGTPSAEGTFTVSTIGGEQGVTIDAVITIKIPGIILADWYSFQESEVSLAFVSFAEASVSTEYYDQENPDNNVAYTPGALRLDKGTGTMTLTLKSLDILKIRWYATGERTLKITWGAEGTENTWTSSSQYESGAHEFDLTDMIPELVSATPITVCIVNNREDGGSFNIHDLYVEGTEIPLGSISFSTGKHQRECEHTFTCSGNNLLFYPDAWSNVQPVIIMDMLGRTVEKRVFSPVFNVEGLNSGIYFLKQGNVIKRFVRK